MAERSSNTVVYFDGSCALCSAEIGYYRGQDHTGALCFVDVSEMGATTPAGISKEQAMARFHVRAGDGRVLSGAAAFVEIWGRLPKWRWLARVASSPGALVALEVGYRLFLPIRPVISRFCARLLRMKRANNGVQGE